MSTTLENALPLWGMQGAAWRLIATRENHVYQVDHNGRSFAFRLHRQGYRTDAELWSELEWMAAVAKGGLHVPAPISSASGQFLQVVDCVQVDVLTWLEGQPIGATGEPLNVGDRTGLFQGIGREMARLHNISDDWSLPKGFARWSWDRNGLLGDAPLWGRFWDNPTLSGKDRNLFLRARG